jgi:hypothetical protein
VPDAARPGERAPLDRFARRHKISVDAILENAPNEELG